MRGEAGVTLRVVGVRGDQRLREDAAYGGHGRQGDGGVALVRVRVTVRDDDSGTGIGRIATGRGSHWIAGQATTSGAGA